MCPNTISPVKATISYTASQAKKCGAQYVGETKRRLMDRFQEHFRAVTKNSPKNDVAYHFNQPDHNGLDDMNLHILDFIHLHPDSREGHRVRLNIEMNWIHRLHSQQPIGLNI